MRRIISRHALPSHGSYTSVDPYFVMPFIVKGYRHVACASDCVLSSLTLSNELVNIWSHVLGALYFVFEIYRLMAQHWSWDSPVFIAEEHFPLLLQHIGCVIAMSGSTLAHVFHSQSEWHHQAWFIVDYFSISYYCVSTAIAHYSYSRPMDPDSGAISVFSTNGYLSMALVLHLCIFISQCYVRFGLYASPFRPYVLITGYLLAYTINFLPFLSRFFSADGERGLPSDQHHWAQFFWSFASAVVMAVHMPQRLAPHYLYFLHGHALMHIGMFCSVLQQRTALRLDEHRWQLLADSATSPQPSLRAIGVVLCLHVLIGSIAGYVIAFHGINVAKIKAQSVSAEHRH
eukprot:scpid55170/ scgid11165/ Membrane progestin receptor gamma-A; Progestin and adipoQ receptor family member V-A